MRGKDVGEKDKQEIEEEKKNCIFTEHILLAWLSSWCFKYTSGFNLHNCFDGNVIFPALKAKNLIIWRLNTLPDIRILMTIIVVIIKTK